LVVGERDLARMLPLFFGGPGPFIFEVFDDE
jgi:hypothetical protein